MVNFFCAFDFPQNNSDFSICPISHCVWIHPQKIACVIPCIFYVTGPGELKDRHVEYIKCFSSCITWFSNFSQWPLLERYCNFYPTFFLRVHLESKKCLRSNQTCTTKSFIFKCFIYFIKAFYCCKKIVRKVVQTKMPHTSMVVTSNLWCKSFCNY